MNEQSHKFKDVDLVFNFKKLPSHDQEYLRTMFYETTLNRSVKHSGINFDNYYRLSNNFSLFDDKSAMERYMGEFITPWSNYGSHLLNGKKYYLAWTHENN